MSSEVPPRAAMEPLLFVDSCAVNGFALSNVDPTRALAGSRFRVAYTGGLEAEYRQALAHRFVEPHIKALLRRLLEHGTRFHAGASRHEETDATLVAVSAQAFVVTRDRKPPWDRAASHPGLLIWADIERQLKEGTSLAAILELRSHGRGDP